MLLNFLVLLRSLRKSQMSKNKVSNLSTDRTFPKEIPFREIADILATFDKDSELDMLSLANFTKILWVLGCLTQFANEYLEVHNKPDYNINQELNPSLSSSDKSSIEILRGFVRDAENTKIREFSPTFLLSLLSTIRSLSKIARLFFGTIDIFNLASRED